MKKFLFIALCCLCLCGCGKSWEDDFQTSDIKIRVSEGFRDDTYITYTIKNVSDYTCKSMKAIVEFKSGSLVVEETIHPPVYSSSPLKPNATLTNESAILYKNYDGYTATFKEIDCILKAVN